MGHEVTFRVLPGQGAAVARAELVFTWFEQAVMTTEKQNFHAATGFQRDGLLQALAQCLRTVSIVGKFKEL
jgi:hypothetical protein